MTAKALRILGIDPGLQTTGFGIVDASGPRLQYVASGTIKTSAVARGDLPGRLKVIFDGVCEVARRYEVQCAAVEIVFVNVNPQSTLLLGQARGAALAGLVAGALPVAEYTALQMKKAIVGHGHATKDQVQYYVDLFTKVRETPEWQDFMKTGAFNTTFMTGAEYAKWVETEEKRHETLMKEAGFIGAGN